MNLLLAEMKDTRKGSAQVSRMAMFEQDQGQALSNSEEVM